MESLLPPVQDLSDDDDAATVTGGLPDGATAVLPELTGLSDDDDAALEPPLWRRKNSKRLREESAARVEERATSRIHLKAMLGKKCISCKHRCMEKFSTNSKFKDLIEFRKEWHGLHKLDQDRVVPQHLKVFFGLPSVNQTM